MRLQLLWFLSSIYIVIVLYYIPQIQFKLSHIVALCGDCYLRIAAFPLLLFVLLKFYVQYAMLSFFQLKHKLLFLSIIDIAFLLIFMSTISILLIIWLYCLIFEYRYYRYLCDSCLIYVLSILRHCVMHSWLCFAFVLYVWCVIGIFINCICCIFCYCR